MWRILVVVALVGCVTHNRVTLGPTFGTEKETTGGELTGEASAGDTLMLVLGGTARFGHELGGGAVRLGIALDKPPVPVGVRGGVTLGPTFRDDQGAIDAKFEARGAFAVVWGFPQEGDDPGGSGRFKRLTLGLEVYASVISGGEVLLGFGLTFGSFGGNPGLGIAASRRARSLPIAGR